MSDRIEPPERYEAHEYQKSIGAARKALEGIMELSDESKEEARNLCANLAGVMSYIEKMTGDEQS